jgi:hypothetical protein
MIYHALRLGALLLQHTGADLTLTAHSMYIDAQGTTVYSNG